MRVDGEVLNVLRWQSQRRPPRARSVRRAAPRRVPRPAGAGRHAQSSSGTRVHGRPPARRPFVGLEHGRRRSSSTAGASSPRGRALRVRATTRASTRSRTSSACTTRSTRRELASADRLVGELLDALPPDTALLVTAGPRAGPRRATMAGSTSADWRPHVAMYAGEGRFRYLYARAGRGRRARSPPRREPRATGRGCSRGASCSTTGWLGPGAAGTCAGRVGDVVLAAREPVAFVDPALPRRPSSARRTARSPPTRCSSRSSGPAAA